MRIAFLGRFNPTEILSGPEKVAKRLFAAMKETEHDVVFVEYFFDGWQYGYWKKLFGYDLIAPGIHRIGILRMPGFLLGWKPDIIHIITFERFVVIAFFVRLMRKCRIVFTVHGILKLEHQHPPRRLPTLMKWKELAIEKWLMERADRLIVLSRISFARVAVLYEIDGSKVSIVPNGVDSEFFRGEEIGEVRAPLRLLFVGDWRRAEKGLEFLLKAVCELNEPLQLTIIGDNEDRPLQQAPESVEISWKRKVATDEWVKILMENDVFVSASDCDQFSISTAEAMASGLAVIVTRETGISEHIKEKLNGLVIPFGDAELLSKALVRLREEPGLRRSIQGNARETANRFRWTEVVMEHLSIYSAMARTLRT